MYGKLIRKAYPLYMGARYRDSYWWKYYQELKESQWWSADRIAILQLDRLKALLRYAYLNVPYYTKKFREMGLEPDDIKTTDDLTKLPILTKKDVRENLPDLVARNFPQTKLIPYSTGGSTGEPLQFYITEETSNRGAGAAWRAYYWYGYEWGDKVAYLWGSQRDLSIQANLSNKISHLIFRTVYLDAFDMSEKRMEEFAQKLAKFKPKVIIAYASAAHLFAKYLKYRQIYTIKPRAVITQAEKLLQEQRQLIEEVFNCEVFDFYGSREVSTMSAECPQHKGYHVSAENVVLEFIKDNKPVPPGETGKILVTDLHNYAMPFIRYENGDLGVPSGEKCSCGRGLPLMHSIEGRLADILVFGDKMTTTLMIPHLFKDLPIKQYQLVQEIEGELTIKIVKTDKYTGEHTEQILKLMQTYVGSNIKLNLRFVSQIPPTKSGKYRFIISKVPVKF